MSYAQPQPPFLPLIVLVGITALFVTCSQIQDVGPQFEKKRSVTIRVPIPDEKCLLRCDTNCDKCSDAADGDADGILLCEIDKDWCYKGCTK